MFMCAFVFVHCACLGVEWTCCINNMPIELVYEFHSFLYFYAPNGSNALFNIIMIILLQQFIKITTILISIDG